MSAEKQPELHTVHGATSFVYTECAEWLYHRGNGVLIGDKNDITGQYEHISMIAQGAEPHSYGFTIGRRALQEAIGVRPAARIVPFGCKSVELSYQPPQYEEDPINDVRLILPKLEVTTLTDERPCRKWRIEPLWLPFPEHEGVQAWQVTVQKSDRRPRRPCGADKFAFLGLVHVARKLGEYTSTDFTIMSIVD